MNKIKILRFDSWFGAKWEQYKYEPLIKFNKNRICFKNFWCYSDIFDNFDSSFFSLQSAPIDFLI